MRAWVLALAVVVAACGGGGGSAEPESAPVLDPWIPFAAPVLGGITGLLAGIYPALRAASLEPVEALRHGA